MVIYSNLWLVVSLTLTMDYRYNTVVSDFNEYPSWPKFRLGFASPTSLEPFDQPFKLLQRSTVEYRQSWLYWIYTAAMAQLNTSVHRLVQATCLPKFHLESM